jgi:hypothetical protein
LAGARGLVFERNVSYPGNWRLAFCLRIWATGGEMHTVNPQRFGMSSSGKTIIIASTEGNQSIPEHEEIKIGLNVYTKDE